MRKFSDGRPGFPKNSYQLDDTLSPPHHPLPPANPEAHMGSSTENVAFQVYEILKIDHEFLQFF